MVILFVIQLQVLVQLSRSQDTVEPPITDSPRYGSPLYSGQTMCPRLILSYKYYIFDGQETDNLQYIYISGQLQTEHVPKGQVAVQNSLQKQTKVGVLDENCQEKYQIFDI